LDLRCAVYGLRSEPEFLVLSHQESEIGDFGLFIKFNVMYASTHKWLVFVWVCLGLLGFSTDMGHPWPLSKAKRLAEGSRKLDAAEYRDGEMLDFGDSGQI
jgi:hypothetical protein